MFTKHTKSEEEWSRGPGLWCLLSEYRFAGKVGMVWSEAHHNAPWVYKPALAVPFRPNMVKV